MGNKKKIEYKGYIEYQLKLRELAYNLLNSKTIFELDQNRLIAKKYIYENFKDYFDNELETFYKILKTDKYKNTIDNIYNQLQQSISALALISNNKVSFWDRNNDGNFQVVIYNEKNKNCTNYIDVPLLCVFESCLYGTLPYENLAVYNCLDVFYSERGKTVINNIINPTLFNRLISKYDIETFNNSVDFIITNSKIEYYLANLEYEPIYAVSQETNSQVPSSKFKIELVSTALCQVLLQLIEYIKSCLIEDTKNNKSKQKPVYDISSKKVQVVLELSTQRLIIDGDEDNAINMSRKVNIMYILKGLSGRLDNNEHWRPVYTDVCRSCDRAKSIFNTKVFKDKPPFLITRNKKYCINEDIYEFTSK